MNSYTFLNLMFSASSCSQQNDSFIGTSDDNIFVLEAIAFWKAIVVTGSLLYFVLIWRVW